MSKIAIDVQSLDKIYRIGLQDERSETFAGAIVNTLKAPLKNIRRLKGLSTFKNKEEEDIFYALQNISFKINKGEVVGIIGRNGAGKSTLLKVLSRITEPSNGKVNIYGRVASLLEVGTGFNPELTGRENMYLNGTILGMSKIEIDRKFDEIVAFSGIEKFLDTPVKRYSSGMRVRLAFSVAAHLEPEILIIDEVLAVGDMEFQKKCLGKMNEVASEGRTVLFVSHNMGAVQELCTRGIVLKKGQLVFDGSVQESIAFYMDDSQNEPMHRRADAPVNFGQIRLNGKAEARMSSSDALEFSVPIISQQAKDPRIIFVVQNSLGQNMVHLALRPGKDFDTTLEGSQLLKISLPQLNLTAGIYAAFIKAIVSHHVPELNRIVSETLFFEVEIDEEVRKGGFQFGQSGRSMLAPPAIWELQGQLVEHL